MNHVTGTVGAQPAGGLFAGYQPPTNVYDELATSDGTLRAPWQRFAAGLEDLGAQGWAQRADQARLLLRENGVTYNIYGAPEGPARPWELDPLPLLFGSAEWQQLSTALTQRVTLLNRILCDLYGPQELLTQGVLPPKLVFGPSGFLRPCHALHVPDDLYLHLHACHLARQPNGQWVVLADRSQGPSGAGYAVENRIVISRTLPADFQSLHVERLASFFITLRETMQRLATRNKDNPRVVLLSPGPQSSTYFEDTYLARYLGYTLVEGGDLTVRGTQVFLKTLGGLLPVDVILRRIPDDDCDPLELRGDSVIGPPGLVQAARSGQVAVANALGSGFLEAPALLAFLPDVCRFLLDEDLLLPSVPTWWCGRQEDLRYVETHLEELLVRPAFSHRSAAPTLGWTLNDKARASLLDEIRHRPGMYVAQSRIIRSTSPVWNNGTFQPWHVGLRTFAVAARDGYRVMPGGLSRVSPSADQLGASLAEGERSKDVWVLSDRPVSTITLLRPPATAVELRRSTNDLPSRVADNLLWLGRHVERAECMVRHLRSAVVRLTNELDPAGLPELLVLVDAMRDEPSDTNEVPSPDLSDVLAKLRSEVISFIFDPQLSYGLHKTFGSLRRTASIVRDRISVDCWRIVNQLNLDTLNPGDKNVPGLGEVLFLLNQMLTLLSAFGGLATESMTRGPGWRFLDMGRRIERALQTLCVVQRTLVNQRAELVPVLEAVLEIADSSMTYRYRYLTSLQLAPVLDLLLVDETNPRAVGFQLNALSEHVENLPRDVDDSLYHPEEKIMQAAQAALRLTDVEALCEADSAGVRDKLDQLLEQLSEHLRRLAERITHIYLIHTGPSRKLGVLTSLMDVNAP